MLRSGAIFIIIIMLASFAGCSGTDSGEPVTEDFTFDTDLQGWEGGFSDVPLGYETQGYDINFSYAGSPMDEDDGGCILIEGNNHSDDLFLYTDKKFGSSDGLKKSSTYQVSLSFDLITNIPSGMMGIGGSPGESVYIKAGIVSEEPLSIEDPSSGESYYRMNIDKGNQSTDGQDVAVLGNAAKGEGPYQGDESYQYKHFEHEFQVTSGENGELWIILGADSGYEGIHYIYFDNVSVTFTPVPDSE